MISTENYLLESLGPKLKWASRLNNQINEKRIFLLPLNCEMNHKRVIVIIKTIGPITLNKSIKKTGLQKQFIAKKSNISPIQLSHILSGRRKAKPEVLKRIMEVISKANFD